MEKQLKSVRNLVNKIIKNLGRSDLDWTVQVSINSTETDKVKYCCQIQAPANGLEPLTWICDSWDDLEAQLKSSVKNLDSDAVQRAWHEAEIARCEALIKYHKAELEKDDKEE